MMSVQTASRKPVSWLTTSTVACVSFCRRLMNQSTVAWSRWFVGSSSSMMSGSMRMHRARASFMRQPPLSADVGPFSFTSSKPRLPRISSSIWETKETREVLRESRYLMVKKKNDKQPSNFFFFFSLSLVTTWGLSVRASIDARPTRRKAGAGITHWRPVCCRRVILLMNP
jgi:hypothetical protein